MKIRGITKETEKMKSTNDVLDHHLKAIEQGDVDAVLSDYAPDAVLFREDGVFRGAAAIRPVFEEFVAEFQKPGTTISTKRRLVEETITRTWCGRRKPLTTFTNSLPTHSL
jgi:ketosteroid isomerase-like protein